jgi:uncharacterized protein
MPERPEAKNEAQELANRLNALIPRYREFPESVQFRASEVEGTGLFAQENIEAGEEVGKLGGVLVHVDKISDYLNTVGNFGPQVNEDWYISPLTKDELPGAINHSCEPNIGMKDELTFVAIRPIKKGEELFADYGMTGLMKPFSCNCGSTDCRHQVTADDWKNERLQRGYGKYFSPYRKKRAGIEASNSDLKDFLSENSERLKQFRDQGLLQDQIY